MSRTEGWVLLRDLKAAAGGDAVDGDYGVGGFGGLQELPGLNKPVVAAVHGLAMGGGFELALSCDLIYASRSSQFGLPEINAGTLADAATIKLPKRMPYHVAMELLLTGRWMGADEAHRWGVVNAALADETTLTDRVWEVARLLETGPPLVFAAIKEVARVSEGAAFQGVMDQVTGRTLPTVDTLYSSEDGLEGFKAFAEYARPCGRAADIRGYDAVGKRYTDTWERDSPVNSAPAQSASRLSSSNPASCAIRSSSAGQM
jgi:crotonobetainyl-CoA hydratase